MNEHNNDNQYLSDKFIDINQANFVREVSPICGKYLILSRKHTIIVRYKSEIITNQLFFKQEQQTHPCIVNALKIIPSFRPKRTLLLFHKNKGSQGKPSMFDTELMLQLHHLFCSFIKSKEVTKYYHLASQKGWYKTHQLTALSLWFCSKSQIHLVLYRTFISHSSNFCS